MTQTTTTPLPDYPCGRPGDVVVHAGPRLEPRSIVARTSCLTTELQLEPGTDLFSELDRCRARFGVEAGTVEFLAGGFSDLRYVHPAFGPDADHPMSFTSEIRPSEPTEVHHGTGTVGFRGDEPFSHLHASFRTESGAIRGGHLLPGTMVGDQGLQIRFHALSWVRWLSETDPETGFSAFAPTAAEVPTAAPVAAPDSIVSATGNAGTRVAPRAAVIARIRPGEMLDEAITRIATEAGFPRAEIVAGLGSTVGALLEDSEVDWPAVEFTQLFGTVGPAGATVHGEAVDIHGEVHSGLIRNGVNPVAVTVEILIAEAI